MNTRKRTWKIIDRGEVPEKYAQLIPYGGPCGHEAWMPVWGMVIAETSGGNLIFDNPSTGRIPKTIHCRKCRRTYTTEEPEVTA